MFGIFKFLMNEEKTKMWNNGLLLQKKRKREENRGDAEARFFYIFRERDSTFSLDFRLI